MLTFMSMINTILPITQQINARYQNYKGALALDSKTCSKFEWQRLAYPNNRIALLSKSSLKIEMSKSCFKTTEQSCYLDMLTLPLEF